MPPVLSAVGRKFYRLNGIRKTNQSVWVRVSLFTPRSVMLCEAPIFLFVRILCCLRWRRCEWSGKKYRNVEIVSWAFIPLLIGSPDKNHQVELMLTGRNPHALMNPSDTHQLVHRGWPEQFELKGLNLLKLEVVWGALPIQLSTAKKMCD